MVTVRRAVIDDIPHILLLMQPFVQRGIVLHRSEDEIESEIDSFFTAYENEVMVGVVSYHDYDNNLFEIRSLVVKEDHFKSGVGSSLVEHAIHVLRQKHTSCRIFALTYVPEFFIKLNFEQLDKSLLPEKIWKDCNNCPSKYHCTETALIYNG
jgi:amino-acid N-acetyltransferase